MGRHFNRKAGTVFILNLGCFNPDIFVSYRTQFLTTPSMLVPRWPINEFLRETIPLA
jgi:hypothetical protein